MPLDEDDEHATYDPGQVGRTSPPRPTRRSCSPPSARPTAGARRRSTPGGDRSTWRSTSSRATPAEPPSDDFIMRNAMDAQEVAVGWWPGDARYSGRPSTPTPTRRPRASPARDARPAGRALGRRARASTCSTGTTSAPPPTRRAAALEFARSAFSHACAVCGWDPALPASAEGRPAAGRLAARLRAGPDR